MSRYKNRYYEWLETTDTKLNPQGEGQYSLDEHRTIIFTKTVSDERVAIAVEHGVVRAKYFEGGRAQLMNPVDVTQKQALDMLNRWCPAEDACFFQDDTGQYSLHVRYFGSGPVGFPLDFWNRYDDFTTMLPVEPGADTEEL